MTLILLVLVVAVIFAPQLWARHVLTRYGEERSDLPGSGAELARHLLHAADMEGYAVKRDERGLGDHFDPTSRTVALSDAHHDRRSLAAAVVAAHEVGHAIQHYIGYRPLAWRTGLARAAAAAERIGAIVLIAMPLVTVLTRAPAAGAGLLLSGVTIMLLPVLVHLLTLPVELDASFRRAMPVLEQGYLDRRDLRRARRILAACALTYLAASLASLLNFWRWIAILRR